MPSLGGRVPQGLSLRYASTVPWWFQCPLWADGSRREELGRLRCRHCVRFNALFGRTGPAGGSGAIRSWRPRPVSMPSLGGRVPQEGRQLKYATATEVVSMPSLGGRVPQGRISIMSNSETTSFNALFGRTGPAGRWTPTRSRPPRRCFNALFGRTGPAGMSPHYRKVCPATSFNALFGRTGPAGSEPGALRQGHRRAVSMPSLGGRVPQAEFPHTRTG